MCRRFLSRHMQPDPYWGNPGHLGDGDAPRTKRDLSCGHSHPESGTPTSQSRYLFLARTICLLINITYTSVLAPLEETWPSMTERITRTGFGASNGKGEASRCVALAASPAVWAAWESQNPPLTPPPGNNTRSALHIPLSDGHDRTTLAKGPAPTRAAAAESFGSAAETCQL